MAGTRLDFFLKSVGYPERAPEGSLSFTLQVDGTEVLAEETGGRIVLSCPISSDEAIMPQLAVYAAGRMLREDATLAYDKPSAILWQDVPADSDAHGFHRFFETFLDSRDWWRARVEAFGGNEAADEVAPETMVIRP